MILVGNQRGGAKNLALHLLKEENDHVRVHELRGFASDNLVSALNESYAVSRGTRCSQFLFSLSLNPPPSVEISTEEFEAVINRAEATLGLSGQPRAIVFHEKEGPGGIRIHAHAVWSRIIAEEMKAVQLSHTHRKLTDLSRELYIEHQWKMPRGLMASEERDIRNFTLEQWQQAKRAEKPAPEIKAAFKECWAVSDSRAAFAQALDSRGYKLARGDKRGFVAVDMKGEVYSVAKWVEIKTKEVRARLGELDESLPSVEARKNEFAAQISQRLVELNAEEERKRAAERERAEIERRAIVERQRAERARQDTAQRERWSREMAERQQRFNRGLRGLLDRLTGQYARLRDQNIAETHQTLMREREERDALTFQHLNERRICAARQREAARELEDRKQELDSDLRRYTLPPDDRYSAEPTLEQRGGSSRSPPANIPAPSPAVKVAASNPAPIAASPSPVPPPPAPPPPSMEVDGGREARRAAYMQERQSQATAQTQDRGPRHDLSR